jgi:DNA modification methylase
MGSGSTIVACINTNRKYIGIEKELKYFEIAKKRIESVNAIQMELKGEQK